MVWLLHPSTYVMSTSRDAVPQADTIGCPVGLFQSGSRSLTVGISGS